MNETYTFLGILSAIIVAGAVAAWKLYVKPYKDPDISDMFEPTTMPVEPPETPVILPVAPSLPIEVPIVPNKATLTNLCLGLRDFEGKPGDQNYRLNNPGNCRWNLSGYMPMYGDVRRSPNGFATFPTYELGWLYLQNMIKGQIHKRPNQTLLGFMTRYAPESDNNPTLAYTKFLAARLGVGITFRMGDLVLS